MFVCLLFLTSSVLQRGGSKDYKLPCGAKDLFPQLFINHAAYLKIIFENTRNGRSLKVKNTLDFIMLMTVAQVLHVFLKLHI